MADSMAKSCKPYSSIKICIIKSIRCTKFKKMAKNLISCSFCTIYAHYACISNQVWPITMATCWVTFSTTIICNIRSIRVSKVEKKAENPGKPHFLLFFCTIYAHYAYLINCSWPKSTATCWETFRTTIIYNIESIRATKVEKNANVHICTIYAHCA